MAPAVDAAGRRSSLAGMTAYLLLLAQAGREGDGVSRTAPAGAFPEWGTDAPIGPVTSAAGVGTPGKGRAAAGLGTDPAPTGAAVIARSGAMPSAVPLAAALVRQIGLCVRTSC